MHRNQLSFAVLVVLAVEFFDELVYGAREAAWPQIRDDLSLSYTEVGLLLAIPPIIGNLIEPMMGLWGNSQQRRRRLILGGGLSLIVASLVYAITDSFWIFLLAASLYSPAAGAFVSLSQASLMDAAPEQREKNMTRWTFSGYVGVVVGPLLLGALVWLGFSWRAFFTLSAILVALLLFFVWRHPLPIPQEDAETKEPALTALRESLKNPEVLRHVILLELADLMSDVLYGFLALYLVDVSHLTPTEAALGVTVWTLAGLAGDGALIFYIEKIDSTQYLRRSALLCIIIFSLFQLAPSIWMTFILLALLGASRAGWYSILQARLYTSMHGKSALVLTLTNIFNFMSAFIPLVLGALAEQYGLRATLWLLLIGPFSILLAVRRR
jgi:FSR family fosmidomycin resistance protein-like MFS transporter